HPRAARGVDGDAPRVARRIVHVPAFFRILPGGEGRRRKHHRAAYREREQARLVVVHHPVPVGIETAMLKKRGREREYRTVRAPARARRRERSWRRPAPGGL